MRKVDKSDSLRISQKWRPVIDNKMQLGNSNVVEFICLYCEWYTSDVEDQNTLLDRISEIKSNIDNYCRLEIVGKYFNPASGQIEYKLSNDKYIPVEKIHNFGYKLSEDEIIKIFGIEFVDSLNEWEYSVTDPQKFRDKRVNILL